MIFALWLLRILIILLILRYVVAFFTPRRQPSRRTPTRAPERTGGTLVRDPQCGTHVPQSSAISLKRGGATMYFCSTTCRDTWLAGQGS